MEIIKCFFAAAAIFFLVAIVYYLESSSKSPWHADDVEHHLNCNTSTEIVNAASQKTVEANNHDGLPSLTFWTSDLHDGTRIDTPSVLQYLGQKVIVNSHKRSFSRFPEVMERFILPHALSPVINTYHQASQDLTEYQIQENFRYYQDDNLMALTDAFICSFPASFCEIWMPFNKSMIFMPVHRFLLGRCNIHTMRRLIDHLQAMNKSTSPKHFIAAGGPYDAAYINYFTGLNPIVLSTSSFFYAGRGVTKYTQKKKEIIVGPLQRDMIPDEDERELADSAARRSTKKDQWIFATAHSLYGSYTLQNVADHRAVVLFPYAVLSYGITELYAMGIPILAPSLDFLIARGWIRDRCVRDQSYCGPNTPMPPKHRESIHPYSPEEYDEKSLRYWLQFADYYQWPHITYFESFDDLIDKLEAMDFAAIHEKMVESNRRREEKLVNQWKDIIRSIQPARAVPKDYHQGILELWNVNMLQVE